MNFIKKKIRKFLFFLIYPLIIIIEIIKPIKLIKLCQIKTAFIGTYVQEVDAYFFHKIDVLLFSGHKTYAPGSPGVIIARKSFLSAIEPEEVGGGMVDKVFPDNYFVSKVFPDREEAGTPNILGAITLGAAIHVLDSIGMDIILKEDTELIQYELKDNNSNIIYIFFDKKTLNLSGWKTIDPYSNDVIFLLRNIKTNVFIEKNIFKIPKEEDL